MSLPDWTKLTAREKAEAIRPHLAAGESNSKIASLFLNCGRCQIAGTVNRMKVTGLNPPVRRTNSGSRATAKTPRAPKAVKRPKPTARTLETTSWRSANNPHRNDVKGRAEQRAASPGLPPALIAGEPIRVRAETSKAPPSLKLDLMQLTDKTCRWPQGDPLVEGFHFCGNDTRMVSTYCPYHKLLSYTPATVRQRAGLRSAERLK